MSIRNIQSRYGDELLEVSVILVVLYKGRWGLSGELVLWLVRRASASGQKRDCSCLARMQAEHLFI